jgi:hypothetical protein
VIDSPKGMTNIAFSFESSFEPAQSCHGVVEITPAIFEGHRLHLSGCVPGPVLTGLSAVGRVLFISGEEGFLSLGLSGSGDRSGSEDPRLERSISQMRSAQCASRPSHPFDVMPLGEPEITNYRPW